MKKILITGGEGILARYVKELFDNCAVLSLGRKDLDVTDKKRIKKYFSENSPDIVIHLAAKTNVDKCEQYQKETFLVNSEGAKNIAEACSLFKAKMVYISTANVFDGNKKEFFETDPTNPLNIYGKSKLLGEEYVKKILKDFLIIRLGWLIGGGRNEKKFISYILDQIKKEKQIWVVNDKFGSVVYAKNVAEFIKTLIEKNAEGIYHYGSKSACSRFNIAEELVRLTKTNVRIIPVNSSYFSSTFFAPRPKREVLGSKKIKFPKTWQQNLETYFNSELKDIL